MRKLILGLVILTGGLLTSLLFQQLMVEGELGPAAMVGAACLFAIFLALLTTLLLSRTRHRALVANLWLAAFATGLSYLVLDLAAGYVLIRALSPPLVPDEVRHHRLVPDSFAEFQQRDFSYVQRVNKHGLRGKEFSTDKAPGSYRIIMLGDSFTMGKGVEDDQTFSVVLENELRPQAAACGKSVEILNAGVDSYAPILGLLYLKGGLQVLKPDMVIYNLDVSDLVQESAYRRQAIRGTDGEIAAVPLRGEPESAFEQFRTWTERHLFFTRVGLLYASRLLGDRALTVRDVVTRANLEVVAHTLAGDVDRQGQWRDIFDSIVRMKQFCDERGIEFLLTVYPWAHQISDTEWVPGRDAFVPKGAQLSSKSIESIREQSAANDIQLVEAEPAFRANSGKAPLYFSYDMHWTAAGQNLMATVLEGYLTNGTPRSGASSGSGRPRSAEYSVRPWQRGPASTSCERPSTDEGGRSNARRREPISSRCRMATSRHRWSVSDRGFGGPEPQAPWRERHVLRLELKAPRVPVGPRAGPTVPQPRS